MFVRELSLPGLVLLGTATAIDDRGAFTETFNARALEQAGITENFVQDNFVVSNKAGTLRGLHFQRPPHAQAKLMRVFRGRIWDVVVDVRQGSPSYGKWEGVELSADGGSQLYVPAGFAHGYLTLEDNTEVFYKVTDFYAPECEDGIIWDDPDVAIDWPLGGRAPELSEKDALLPRLENLRPAFDYVEAQSVRTKA